VLHLNARPQILTYSKECAESLVKSSKASIHVQHVARSFAKLCHATQLVEICSGYQNYLSQPSNIFV